MSVHTRIRTISGVAVQNRSAAIAVLVGTGAAPDTVSVVQTKKGWEYRAISVSGSVELQRRTLAPSGPWVTLGTETGTQGEVLVNPDGRPIVHLNDGGTIKEWDQEAGTVAIIGEGSQARGAWNAPANSLQLRTRWRSGVLYSEVLDALYNSISGEVAVATVAECAGDTLWHADGTPGIHYPDGGSIIEVRSTNNGRSWI